MARPLLALLLLALATGARAEPAYITDSISVALFPTAELTGEPLQRLLSGTPVEIVERRGEVARIRTGGGSEGWIRATFLSISTPATVELDQALAIIDELQDELASQKVVIDELQDELAAARKGGKAQEQLARDVRWLKAELKKTRSALAEAEQALEQKREGETQEAGALAEAQEQIARLEALNQELRMKLAASELILSERAEATAQTEQAPSPLWPLLGIVVAVVAAAAGGFYAGYRYLDRKVVERFGGIRFH